MGTRLPKEKLDTHLTTDSHTHAHADTADALSGEGPACGVTESLVRRLVRHVAQVMAAEPRSQHHDPEQQPAHEVVLDMEVEGFRCLLVRLPACPARAQTLLSPREQEIARMVAEGYPNKTIAAVLDISSWTVCTHLRRVFAKLGVGSRAAMVARLLEDGLLHQHHAYRPAALRKLS